jgi:hypothetical protein
MLALATTTSGPAHAGCSLSDLTDALTNFVGDGPAFLKDHAGCAPLFANPAFWTISGGVTLAASSSGDVRSACQEVENLDASAGGYQDKIKSLFAKLPPQAQQAINALPGVGDINNSSADLAEVLSFLSCACALATESGITQLGQVAGDCLEEALCWADDFFFDNPCSGVPPPKLVDCANAHVLHDKQGYSVGIENGVPYYSGFTKCEGDFCFFTSSAGGPVSEYCYCPKPMVQKIRTESGWGSYISCECPEHTHRPDKGHVDYSNPITARICLCDSTNEIVNPDGSCPPPCNCGCPSNQVVLAKDFNTCQCTCGCPDGQTLAGGKCVTPCTGANQILLANGSCCLATQVTSCGNCCGGHSRPDAATGSCVYMPDPPPKAKLVPQLPKNP